MGSNVHALRAADSSYFWPAGSASKGLYRVHQFSKVELFVLCTPQQSEGLLQELSSLEEDMFTQLGLHFKTLVCLPGCGSLLCKTASTVTL